MKRFIAFSSMAEALGKLWFAAQMGNALYVGSAARIHRSVIDRYSFSRWKIVLLHHVTSIWCRCDCASIHTHIHTLVQMGGLEELSFLSVQSSWRGEFVDVCVRVEISPTLRQRVMNFDIKNPSASKYKSRMKIMEWKKKSYHSR